jgi:hypothetical protein
MTNAGYLAILLFDPTGWLAVWLARDPHASLL